MTCSQAREALPELVEGLLDGAARGEVEAHLAGCPACAAEAATLRRVDALLAAAVDEAPPAGLWAAIDERLSAARPRPVLRRWVLAGAVAVTAAALALLRPPAAEPVTPYLRDHYRAASVAMLGNPAVGDVMSCVAMEQNR